MNVNSGMITVFVVRPDASGRTHEFLQLYRSAQSWAGQTWQVVRGKVEPGETFINAALRELREETGLSPREFFRIGSVETFYTSMGDTVWHSVPFCAMIDRTQEVILNSEHTDLRWVPRSEMEKRVMWAGEVRLLHDLYRDILDHGVAREHLRVDLPPSA